MVSRLSLQDKRRGSIPLRGLIYEYILDKWLEYISFTVEPYIQHY